MPSRIPDASQRIVLRNRPHSSTEQDHRGRSVIYSRIVLNRTTSNIRIFNYCLNWKCCYVSVFPLNTSVPEISGK